MNGIKLIVSHLGVHISQTSVRNPEQVILPVEDKSETKSPPGQIPKQNTGWDKTLSAGMHLF